MPELKKAAIALAIILLAALAVLLALNQTTGFFTLQNQQAGSSQDFSANLSVKAIQETKLSAKLLQSGIEQCPAFMNLAFEITNSGRANAERLFVKPSENLKVIECINCNARQLFPSEKITVRLKACRTNNEKASVSFSSINAMEERIEMQ